MKVFFVILLFAISSFSQQIDNSGKFACSDSNKPKICEYFEQIEAENRFIGECKEKSEKAIFEGTDKIPRLIDGDCQWTNNGCPVNLVLPKFPILAKELKISGAVNIEIIINREGKIIKAKALNGHKLLRISALEAACNSRFSRKIICEKEVMQKRIIRYNFIL